MLFNESVRILMGTRHFMIPSGPRIRLVRRNWRTGRDSSYSFKIASASLCFLSWASSIRFMPWVYFAKAL